MSESAPTDQEFLVELPVFSGPFRLLAELILDQRVDVCDVPVALLTESFLRRGTEEMNSWTLEESTWFLAVCAVMLELKVGRLLPRPSVETEEDLLGGASPDLLYARTIELAAFRLAAANLSDRMAEASLMTARTAGPPAEFAHLYPDVDLSHVTPIRATVEGALETLRRRLSEMSEARFRDLLEDDLERIDVVVRFLAILELHRQGEVELKQAEHFGEIEIRWQEGQADGQPRYSESHGWDDLGES
jgi:segregation and condensation protein A